MVRINEACPGQSTCGAEKQSQHESGRPCSCSCYIVPGIDFEIMEDQARNVCVRGKKNIVMCISCYLVPVTKWVVYFQKISRSELNILDPNLFRKPSL